MSEAGSVAGSGAVLGARDHREDAHPALAEPGAAPAALVPPPPSSLPLPLPSALSPSGAELASVHSHTLPPAALFSPSGTSTSHPGSALHASRHPSPNSDLATALSPSLLSSSSSPHTDASLCALDHVPFAFASATHADVGSHLIPSSLSHAIALPSHLPTHVSPSSVTSLTPDAAAAAAAAATASTSTEVITSSQSPNAAAALHATSATTNTASTPALAATTSPAPAADAHTPAGLSATETLPSSHSPIPPSLSSFSAPPSSSTSPHTHAHISPPPPAELSATLPPRPGWTHWGMDRLRLAKQALYERLGSAHPTVDRELEDEVAQLRETQKSFRRLLELSHTLAFHLFQLAETQKQLQSAFAQLSIADVSLSSEHSANSEAQRVLHKNGIALVGAINFFSENIGTLTFKSIDDTLLTWEEYQRARLAHDAERDSPTRREQTLAGYAQRMQHVREALKVKMELLEKNKLRVFKKQLSLFHSATCAFFAGNQTSLSEALAGLSAPSHPAAHAPLPNGSARPSSAAGTHTEVETPAAFLSSDSASNVSVPITSSAAPSAAAAAAAAAPSSFSASAAAADVASFSATASHTLSSGPLAPSGSSPSHFPSISVDPPSSHLTDVSPLASSSSLAAREGPAEGSA